jgi:agmatinase
MRFQTIKEFSMNADTPRFLESELAPAPAHACRFHVIPVPYEATASYGHGAARGPQAVLTASQQLELWTGRNTPSASGIYTRPAVETHGGPEDVLARIETAVLLASDAEPESLSLLDAEGTQHNLARRGRPTGIVSPEPPVLPVILGGEHTVSLGALRALQKRHGHFGIIQFDAHADLRDSYDGTPYSHACVMRRAVDDLKLALFQIGVRSLSSEEQSFREERGIAGLDARDLDDAERPGRKNTGPLLPPSFPEKVYLTFDVDAFDASLMPATGTPEPGGLFWRQALDLAERALAGRICLGFDVVELAPIPGMHAPEYTAARLVYELMGLTLPRAGPGVDTMRAFPEQVRMPPDNTHNFTYASACGGQVGRVAMTAKELIDKLKEVGWTFREGGNHIVGISPDGTRKTVVKRHSEDVVPGTLRGIERQTGVKLG